MKPYIFVLIFIAIQLDVVSEWRPQTLMGGGGAQINTHATRLIRIDIRQIPSGKRPDEAMKTVELAIKTSCLIQLLIQGKWNNTKLKGSRSNTKL